MRSPFRPRLSFALLGLLALASTHLPAAPATTTVPASAGDPGATTYLIRVQVHDRANEIPRLAAMQLDLAGIDVKAQTADFVGTMDLFLTLLKDGFDPSIVRSFGPESIDALSDYMDPTEVTQRLDNYAATYPGLCKKIQIATTEQGRPEWAMKISDNPNVEEDEPVIFFVGQHHAREVMTPEITMDIIDYLLTRYGTDDKVKHWVDENEIWVVVSHNPDGSNTVFTSNSNWRKNMRDNHDGNFGVDPNRNYPFKWNSCSGSSGDTASDTYRGPSPGSEPETQGFMQLARDHRPALNLSYHTYSELAIHPYGCTGVFSAENRVFRDLSSDLASKIPNDAGDGYYSNGTAWELLYAVDGEMNDWFYGELGSYGTTIEANSSSQGFQPDYATWRDSTVNRNRPGWQYLLDRLEGPGITGHVTDACTGAPLSATISLDEVVYGNGETARTSEPGFGRFTWVTVPGTYHLNVSNAGYPSQGWPVDVGYQMASRPVRLVPNGSFAAEFSSMSVDDSSGDGDSQMDPGETVNLPITVKATGGALTNLTATLTTSDPYVTILNGDVTFGSVAAGGSMISIAPQAQVQVSSQAPDARVIPFTLTFQASQSLCSPVSTFQGRITTGSPSCPAIQENLDSNPGWTIQNSDASGWAFGSPGGGGGASGPPSAHSGSSVYGTNLTGNYADNGSYTLTTTAFDISNLRSVELRYWRWLNNEAGYDVARIEASTDGSSWTEVWKGWGRDTDWQLYRYDLSSIADNHGSLYVRFRLTSDVGVNESGWYLDDISICGETKAPSPRFVITSATLSDGVKVSCSDHDAYADGGEIADLTVNLRNDGNQTATGAEAYIGSTDTQDLGLVTVRSSLGNVPAGGTASAVFRFKVADAAACKEPGTISVEATANSGAYIGTVGQVGLLLEASNGSPVPDTSDNFESNSGWTLTNEWQIDRPRGFGGSNATGGAGGRDPSSAVSGMKVLGLDLTGLGISKGNYENSFASPTYTATSPVYDCTNATGVDVSFERWLCAESSTADRAALEAFDGTAWRTVWSNPASDMSDSSWQSVSYDVHLWADGNPGFRIRFTVTPNSQRAFCGWNVDDLVIGNGYTPKVCDTTSCAAGCKPTTEAQNVRIARNLSGDLVTWTPSTDACRETSGGPTYRMYRSTDPRPKTNPVNNWPGDTYFTDLSGRDADGSAINASFTERDLPPQGQAFFYLVVVMGSNGAEGPVGHYGK